MKRLALFVLPVLLALAPLTAALQEPKMGSDWYEDEVDLGFKVKAPRDWEFVPGSPMERNLIGKYAASNGQYINLGREAFVMVQICLVKFDRRPEANQKEERQIGDKKVAFEIKGKPDIDAWMTGGLDEGKAWHLVEGPEDFKGSLAGKLSIYEGLSNRGRPEAEPQPVRALAAVFALSPDVDVALVGVGPGDKKKWRSFEKVYQSFAKTVQPLELAAKDSGPVGKDPRSQKRAKLEAEIARSPGWSLYETPNYFIISCYDDKAFIEEMKLRLESIRAVYEKDYPPELARMRKAKAPKAPEGEAASPEAQEEPDPSRTQSVVDTLELGKSSVVRVCKDRDQYLSYGGPNGTSGYFSPLDQELVVFDDKENQGRSATWAVMNHEGFHQYTYAFFGNLAPHSWYNEGTGDFYSGFEFNLKTKKFKPEKSIGRQDNLLLIRDRFIPLRDFVHWSKSQYYGANDQKMEGWACYAEGWSLIYFLRMGESEKAKGWQKPWGSILDTYTRTLIETSDLDQALEKAFEGVDWDAIEESWRNFMM